MAEGLLGKALQQVLGQEISQIGYTTRYWRQEYTRSIFDINYGFLKACFLCPKMLKKQFFF